MSIDKAYSLIPNISCKGLCQQACGPIGCSDAEAQRFQNNGISLPTIVDHPTQGSLTCSHLNIDGKCNIYENRPLVCRLFGVVKKMKCKHGCKPERYLTENEEISLMNMVNETNKPPYVAPLPW